MDSYKVKGIVGSDIVSQFLSGLTILYGLLSSFKEVNVLSAIGGDWAGKIVGAVVGIVIAISLLPTVADTIVGTNTSTWSTLTGGTGAVSIFELTLLVFVAGIVVAIVRHFLS